MIEAALKQFHDRTLKMRDEMRSESKQQAERNYQMQLEMKSIENRFEKALNRHLWMTVSILSALIVVIEAVATFARSLIH